VCGITAAARLDQAPVEGVPDQFGAAARAELLLDVGAVGLHGSHADEELLGDLGVGVAEGDQAQNVGLALAQVLAAAIRFGSEAGAERGLKIGLAGGGPPHRLYQLVVRRLLEYVSEHAELQRLPREGGLFLHRGRRSSSRETPPAARGSPSGSPVLAC
jgi:hypothetical protein